MTKRFGLLKSVQASNNKGVTKDIRNKSLLKY